MKLLTFCGSKISFLWFSATILFLLSVERATKSDEKLTPLVESRQSCRNFRRLSTFSLKKKILRDKSEITESRKEGQKPIEGETQSVSVRQAEERSFGSLVVRKVDRNLESIKFFLDLFSFKRFMPINILKIINSKYIKNRNILNY